MLMKRRAAAQRILRQVHSTEALAARTMALMAKLTTQTAALNATMLTARADAELPVVLGQGALDSGAAAYATLTQGMHHIVETHRRLNEARIQAGLRVVGMGDEYQCPEPQGSLAETPVRPALAAVA